MWSFCGFFFVFFFFTETCLSFVVELAHMVTKSEVMIDMVTFNAVGSMWGYFLMQQSAAKYRIYLRNPHTIIMQEKIWRGKNELK